MLFWYTSLTEEACSDDAVNRALPVGVVQGKQLLQVQLLPLVLRDPIRRKALLQQCITTIVSTTAA